MAMEVGDIIETEQPQVEVTLEPGTHVLELVVVDDAGLESEADSVVITVMRVKITDIMVHGDCYLGKTVEADILGENLEDAIAVRFLYEGAEDLGLEVTIQEPGTPSKLTVTINIKPEDASLGVHSFQIEFPNEVVADSPEGVDFTVEEAVAEHVITEISPIEGAWGDEFDNAYISGQNLGGAETVTFLGNGVTAQVHDTHPMPGRLNITIRIQHFAPIGPRYFIVSGPDWDAYSEEQDKPVWFMVNRGHIIPPSGTTGHLNDVRGIGPVYAARLEADGITSLDELALIEAAELAEILQVTEGRAAGFVEEAKRLLGG
jgi:hypothetical protein